MHNKTAPGLNRGLRKGREMMESARDAGGVVSKIKAIDVSAVEGNTILAADVGRYAIERCKDAIEYLGVVHTPIVGATKSGARLLLSGQCELTALRAVLRRTQREEENILRESGQ